MQNIGITFVKIGQYNDAITSFEHIMSESPNFKTGKKQHYSIQEKFYFTNNATHCMLQICYEHNLLTFSRLQLDPVLLCPGRP